MAPRLRSTGFGGLIAAVVFALGYAFNLLALNNRHWVLADALALGALIGLIVFGYEERRARLMAEKVRVIRDMNRFIRNELQVIVSATPESGSSARTIGSCVDNIDWALRELLPGKVHVLEEAASAHGQPEKIDRPA
jgi:hypothetical protein